MSEQDKSAPEQVPTDDKGKSLFDKEGAIGKHFTSEGAIGGTAEKIGGPLSKDGAIGKHFEADGSVGGAVQRNLGDQQ